MSVSRMAGLGIGDTIYVFDENRRKYPTDESGRPTGRVIYREHFVPHYIVGEEARSWLISRTKGRVHARKIGKRHTLTAADVDDRVWLHDHRIELARLVTNCDDVGQLRQVGAALGFEPAAGR